VRKGWISHIAASALSGPSIAAHRRGSQPPPTSSRLEHLKKFGTIVIRIEHNAGKFKHKQVLTSVAVLYFFDSILTFDSLPRHFYIPCLDY